MDEESSQPSQYQSEERPTNQRDLDKVRLDGLSLSGCTDPSDKVIIAAISENKYAFGYVNLDILTNRFVEKLLHACKSLVIELPVSYITKKRLLKAVNEDAIVLEQFTDEHYDFVTAQELIKASVKAFDYLKSSFIDDELSRYAVVRHPQLYQKIPEEIKTKAFNRHVCQLAPVLIGSIPKLHINRKLVRIVLEKDPTVLSLLPRHWQTDYAAGVSGNVVDDDSDGDSAEDDIKDTQS